MIYLIIYEENFFSLKKIIQDILKKEGGRFMIVDLGIGYDAFQSLLLSFLQKKIFNQKIAYLIRNSLSNKKSSIKLISGLEELKANNQDVAVFFIEKEEEKIDKKIITFFKQYGKIFKDWNYSLGDIRKLIQEEIKEKGYNFEKGVEDFLIDNLNADYENIMSELKKIMTYSAKDKKITKKIIASLIKPKTEISIFKTIEAIAAKNKKEALRLVSEHLRAGENPLYILKMIAFQFRNILSIKQKEENPLFNKSFLSLQKAFPGMHPFVIQKSLYQAKKFHLSQLKKIYRKIFQIDLSIKKGKISPREGLEFFILDL